MVTPLVTKILILHIITRLSITIEIQYYLQNKLSSYITRMFSPNTKASTGL